MSLQGPTVAYRDPDPTGRGRLLILEERITIAAVTVLNLLITAFAGLGQAWDIFGLNLLIIVSILGVALFHKRFRSAWMGFFRDWYVPAFLIVVFLESRKLIPLVNPHDLDSLFIRIDRVLFLGHDPTVLLERITCPVLSEILQISYASFYFLPFSLCLILYLARPRIEFHISASTILLGFYLSYLGYYLLPAIGPRFTLDHLQAFPLSGVLLFDVVRGMLDQAEGVMRDCCPSGHVMISLLTVLLARRYARGFFPAAFVWAVLIILSTVYLRYHYVVDLAAGAGLGLLVYGLGPGLAGPAVLRSLSAYYEPDALHRNFPS